MRILFLETTLAVGGAERQLALLATHLRARGFEPTVATLRHRGRFFDELRAAGIPTVFVGMQSRWDVRGAARAYRLWKTRPELVVTHSIDAQLIGQAIADRIRAPHVTVEHGGAGIQRGLHRALLVRLVALRVDRVVAISASQLGDLRTLWYGSQAISVIPNGIPELTPSRPRDEVRSELGFLAEDIVAVLVAGLRQEKRPDVFVDAVAHAHAQDPRVRGLIVGGGRELAAIREQARTVESGVQVLGERVDVADLMAASDAVCLSSDVEGLPVSILEAMSLAKPVIATDVGGLRDAVVPGETGWLVPRRDPASFAAALLELAADGARSRAMGEEAHRRFRDRFTVDAMVDGYEELFADVARSRR